MTWLALLLVSTLLTACGDGIGMVCHFSGSGFTASDNCRHRCMQHRDIVCPDNTSIRPAICSGKPDCEPGGCPADQTCYHVNDPFKKESYCLPDTVCGPQSAEALAQWERRSQAASQASVAAWEAKQKLRAKSTATVPAVEPSAPER